MPKFIQLKAISGFEDIAVNFKKVSEEDEEFKIEAKTFKVMKALEGLKSEEITEERKKHKQMVIAEFWDTVQSKITLMESIEIPLDEILDGYKIHIEKLEDRGYKFK